MALPFLKNGNGTVKKEEFISELEEIVEKFNNGETGEFSKKWTISDIRIRVYDEERTVHVSTYIEKPKVELKVNPAKLEIKFIDSENEFNTCNFSFEPGTLLRTNYKPSEKYFEYVPSGKSSFSFE